MKTNRRRLGAVLALVGSLACPGWAAETATVKANRVNVRGQASLASEVVTQLQAGETVTILEEIPVKKPKRREPASWARIQLPTNTPVWVFAPYIEPEHKTVNVSRLNLRAGPGENFSVLGRIARGTPVKDIRVVGNWMEIESPANATAYVAANFLDKTGPVTPPPTGTAVAGTSPVTAPTPAAPPPTETGPTLAPAETVTMTVTSETPDTAAVTATPPTPEPLPATPPALPLIAPPALEPEPEPPPKRVVSREGTVILSRSIQAPTDYALESRETRRMINYLHSEQLGLKLKNYAGRKVIVTGEELVDQRWANTPILEVETIHLVP